MDETKTGNKDDQYKLLIDGPNTIPKYVEMVEPEPEPVPLKETPEMKQSRKNIERMLKKK